VTASYLVNEVYPCLQGEGPSLGRPSVLVRFQICNLRCSWCDTPYTHTFKSDPVDPSDAAQGQAFQRVSADVLASNLREYSPVRHLILTGGEPTLQNPMPLMSALGDSYTAEVETNGTRIVHKAHAAFTEADYARFQWNVSPKGRNAGETWNEDALHFWASLAAKQENVFFKFVVRGAHAGPDLNEVKRFVSDFLQPAGADRSRVFLMPEGTTQESQLGQTALHDICLAEGFRYTPRLHVLLFGPRRGV
jgi:7-carboxy-7-deazaguanine synthase